jgi:O-antigen chain-terminating methyltransferase
MNQAMVDECVERGLAAEYGEAVNWLRQAKPGSLGAITAFHVIEHLSQEDLLALIDLSLAALHPGGIIIFETPNPENVVVGACNFYMDPTHNRPLPPQLMQFLVEARGFSEASVMRLGNLSAGLPEPFPVGHAKEKYNPFVHALRHNFFSPPDYAVTAHKR